VAYKATLKLNTPKADKREMYLSPGGFGPEPEIDEIDPEEGLVNSLLPKLEIKGFPFQQSRVDDSPPEVELHLNKQVVAATSVEWKSGERIVASFDLAGLKTGKWDLVVRNPSGAETSVKFRILTESQFKLPNGVKDGTEVWYVEFTDGFLEDLDLFQLRGVDADVNDLAAEAVEAYVIYLLRTHFLLDGRTGKTTSDSVPVSFIIDEVSQAAGFVGEDYNRIVVGGKAREFDGTEDNPFLVWGYTPVDILNTGYDDVGGPESETTAHIPIREMNPTLKEITTGTFREAFMLNRLGASDEKYFLQSFYPETQEEIDRQVEIVRAVSALGRELAAIAAHHVARAMGLPNSDSVDGLFLSGTPDLFGQFAVDGEIAFKDQEIEALQALARLSNLPGKSKDLNAKGFKLMPGNVYLLPEAETNVSYEEMFLTIGGRPDLKREDLRFRGVDGSVPIGYDLMSDGYVEGLAPFFFGSEYYRGAFRFWLGMLNQEVRDTKLVGE
jgi:hypothetical protein